MMWYYDRLPMRDYDEAKTNNFKKNGKTKVVYLGIQSRHVISMQNRKMQNRKKDDATLFATTGKPGPAIAATQRPCQLQCICLSIR